MNGPGPRGPSPGPASMHPRQGGADKKFHFPCEGLAEGHSPTDYAPGMAEHLAASLSESAPSRSQALELVRLLPSERACRGGEAVDSRSFASGAWAKDGAVGLRHNSSLFPESTKILTALIREASPSATFCSVAVFSDLKAEPHIDSNNDERFIHWAWITSRLAQARVRPWSSLIFANQITSVYCGVKFSRQM